MKIRIEAVISAEDYIGKHIGLELLGRPLKQLVIFFEEDVTPEEFNRLRQGIDRAVLDRLLMNSAIRVHSIRMTQNFNH